MAQTKDQLSSNNLIIVMLLVSLLVVGISGLVVKTLITTIVRDTKVADAKRKANDQLKQNVVAAPQLVEAYAALGSQATVLADALPNTADLPSLLVSLENMSVSSGIKLKTVTPALVATPVADTTGTGSETGAASKVGAPQPQPYAFTVTFDGSYGSLQRFMEAVEVSARPMRVVSLQLSGSGSALSGEIGLQTYYQAKAALPFGTETIK